MMLANGISDTKVHLAIKIISNYLYSFHMPAFFALSGCLFWNQIKQNRWTLSSLIGKKFKRLILPLFGTWFFWNIPIKYISGYYLGVPFSKVLLQLIFPNRVYLWYLESLFLVFVIVYITIKLIHNNSWRLIILLLMYTGGIVLQYYANDYIPFGNPMRYCIWFYLGKQIECITDKIRKQRWVTCSILIFDIGLFFVFRHVQETLPIFIIRDFALALMGIAIAFILSDQIGSIASIEHKWFEFGKDEEGNYLPKTVISREYSSEWKPGDEPYYPVNDEKNGNLYAQYKLLADKEQKVIFGGRLGEYRYYDMDQVIESALRKSRELI